MQVYHERSVAEEVRRAMWCLAYNFKFSHFTSFKVVMLTSHHVTPIVIWLSLSPTGRTGLVGKINVHLEV